MNLPKVLADLVAAQNNFDSQAFADCFSDTAVVFDEGKTHAGKIAIKKWIEQANKKYQTSMHPLDYSAKTERLKAEISGNFPGSPLVLSYHFRFKNGQIESLEIV